MDSQTLKAVCEQIYRRFPDVKGSRPKVSAYTGDKSLLVFSGKGTTADGRSILRTVRVVVDNNGKIVKATTSR
ncbi:MAG: hypothetical protein GYA17_08510 [Chloroflexi bacterium]|jgi:hypothetical protein|nr:hypothetical protein [Anaerolineaceae bacterium]NMB88391.1 hypothetical protein [Chloroflexota bacterium]